MSAIIDVQSVSKSFGGVIANQDISMKVEQGAITGLIGPNGSGKTTLFNSIVGFHPIDSGQIWFEGNEISKLPVQKIARLGLLRTFQQTRIYGAMNCVDNMLISSVFGVDLEPHGFIAKGPTYDQLGATTRPGVFVAGSATSPETIDDSIAQGHAAAMSAYALANGAMKTAAE